MSFFSPNWWMRSPKSIILRGKDDGHDQIEPKASNGINTGEPGADGLPGKPGQNGGHFYGRFNNFNGSYDLTINVRGGKGGKGQNGGDGARGRGGIQGEPEGVEGRNPNVRRLLNRGTLEDSYSIICALITCGDKLTIEEYQSGILEEEGGVGGKGGGRGFNGYCGRVNIEKYNMVHLRLIEDLNEQGLDGESGRWGDFGEHKPVFHSVYANNETFGVYFLLHSILKEKLNLLQIGDNDRANMLALHDIYLALRAFVLNPIGSIIYYAIPDNIGYLIITATCFMTFLAIEAKKNLYFYGIPAILSVINSKSSGWRVSPQELPQRERREVPQIILLNTNGQENPAEVTEINVLTKQEAYAEFREINAYNNLKESLL